MASVLLETKLYLPRPRRAVVLRRRLAALIDPPSTPALTVVAAPAGFGKTTMLAESLGTTTDGAGPLTARRLTAVHRADQAARLRPRGGSQGGRRGATVSRAQATKSEGWRRPMTYDEGLADRIRVAVEAAAGPAGYREVKMFGGLCWTVNTHMAVGASNDDLMVYVGKDGVDDALANGARRATMGQRTMGGVVLVAAADLPDAAALEAWVGSAVDRARAKPPKASKR